MLSKLILAVVVGVAAFLICILVGGLMVTLNVPLAVTVGTFLKQYAGVISVLVALWWFFSGQSLPFNRS